VCLITMMSASPRAPIVLLDTLHGGFKYLPQFLSNYVAMHHSKTPSLEDGVLEPIPTFSTCYIAPFIFLHPVAMLRCSLSVCQNTKSTAGLSTLATVWEWGNRHAKMGF
jgi:hypothetical protein